jgi:hypothetical protein
VVLRLTALTVGFVLTRSFATFRSPSLQRWQAWNVLLTNCDTLEHLYPPSVLQPQPPQRCITDRFRPQELVHLRPPSQENTVLDRPLSPRLYYYLLCPITPFILWH